MRDEVKAGGGGDLDDGRLARVDQSLDGRDWSAEGACDRCCMKNAALFSNNGLDKALAAVDQGAGFDICFGGRKDATDTVFDPLRDVGGDGALFKVGGGNEDVESSVAGLCVHFGRLTGSTHDDGDGD